MIGALAFVLYGSLVTALNVKYPDTTFQMNVLWERLERNLATFGVPPALRTQVQHNLQYTARNLRAGLDDDALKSLPESVRAEIAFSIRSKAIQVCVCAFMRRLSFLPFVYCRTSDFSHRGAV